MSERTVLCEGYHDRAFWAGALTHFGCVDPGALPHGERIPVLDLSGKPLKGGHFGFKTKSGAFARIRPCGGRELLVPELKKLLAGLGTRKLGRIVVNIDDDGDARTGLAHAGFPAGVKGVLLEFDPATTTDANGDHVVSAGTVVAATAWWTGEGHTVGLPWKQTLERLVCAAVDDAYPGRGAAVGAWLAGAPNTDAPKAHAWSHMAGWFSDEGGEGFYRLLWSDPLIVKALQPRLEACGAWRLMQAVAA